MSNDFKEDLKALCRKHGINLSDDDWRNFNIDEPVMYQREVGGSWYRGHFAGVVNFTPDIEKDCPCVFQDGKTEFSSNGISSSVRVIRRPYADEYEANQRAK